MINSRLSRNILNSAHQLQNEDEDNSIDNDYEMKERCLQDSIGASISHRGKAKVCLKGDFEHLQNKLTDADVPYDNQQISVEDREALHKFLLTSDDHDLDHDVEHNDPEDALISDPAVALNNGNIADQLVEYLSCARTEIQSQMSGTSYRSNRSAIALTTDQQAFYKKLRHVMANVTGPRCIPHVVKQLPRYADWEEKLELMHPESFTAAAMAALVKYFRHVRGEQCAKFYAHYFLPRLRDDIAQYKKLNDHLYNALISAFWSPRHFIFAIIMPLLQNKDQPCTIREAAVFSGVLKKISMKSQYLSVLLHVLVTCDIAPVPGCAVAQVMFIQVLLEKRSNISLRTVDVLIKYFMRFTNQHYAEPLKNDKGVLRVVWFQALLSFVSLYKTSLVETSRRENIKELCRVQRHSVITPVILQQLQLADKLITANLNNEDDTTDNDVMRINEVQGLVDDDIAEEMMH